MTPVKLSSTTRCRSAGAGASSCAGAACMLADGALAAGGALATGPDDRDATIAVPQAARAATKHPRMTYMLPQTGRACPEFLGPCGRPAHGGAGTAGGSLPNAG